MPAHLMLMSFNADSNLNNTLNQFIAYILASTKKEKNIKMLFVGTASNDRMLDQLFFSGFMLKFREYVTTSRLCLTNSFLTQEQIVSTLKLQDIVFIGGGNTQQMLETWNSTHFTSALNQLKVEDQLPILAGVSAGGMYPFTFGLSDYANGEYNLLPCLGWLAGSFCPHANSSKLQKCGFIDSEQPPVHNRLESYELAVQQDKIPPGYAISDDVMLYFYDSQLVEVFSTRNDAFCYFVTKEKKELINTTYLEAGMVSFSARQALKKAIPEDEEPTETYEYTPSYCSII